MEPLRFGVIGLNFGQFYARRFLRILPPYGLTLIAVWAAAAAGASSARRRLSSSSARSSERLLSTAATSALSLSAMDLITHSLTPVVHINGIRSLIGVGKPCGAPNPFSALPPPYIHEASPKTISGRTSYH